MRKACDYNVSYNHKGKSYFFGGNSDFHGWFIQPFSLVRLQIFERVGLGSCPELELISNQ